MKRTQIYLTERERKKLKSEANQLGIPVSELIRRILDKYLRGKRNEKEK